MNFIKRFLVEDTGAETVEYALVLGLLAVAAVVAIGAVGTQVSSVFNAIGASL